MFVRSQITISGTYGVNDLKEDIKTMSVFAQRKRALRVDVLSHTLCPHACLRHDRYKRAGVKDEGIMFLFTDSQVLL